MTSISDFTQDIEFSVAFTENIDAELSNHMKDPDEEDLVFALWVPSKGSKRFTAIITKVILPEEGDRNRHGNASFNSQYVHRMLGLAKEGVGIAFIHSHIGPGWQGMSDDDIHAEQVVLAGPIAGWTGLPLVGLTRGTDGSWSARFWLKEDARNYKRFWADTVRVVGKRLRTTFHPNLLYMEHNESQVATQSVWGKENQFIVANTHVGIVGLGSVGSIVAECLSRIGVSKLTLIDHEKIETRNLDRTLGTTIEDAKNHTPKVKVSERLTQTTHTSEKFHVNPLEENLLSEKGLKAALDCDVIFSCVDRPYPRHTLNALSYSHLIPVVDGGIIAKTMNDLPIHVDWRIHTVGPERQCLVCLGALKHEEISLDREGKLDDPTYIKNLNGAFDHLTSRQNVIAFSMSLAAHEVLQFVGLVTGLTRIGGIGPQMYHAYPGCMEVKDPAKCMPDCEYNKLTSSATDMRVNILDHHKTKMNKR